MKASFASAWKIVRPYWVSEDRWPARGFLALIVALDMFRVYLNVRMTYWTRDFWDALTAFDVAAFWKQMVLLVILGGTGVFVDTARPWFNQRLEMRWRTWLTQVYLGRWLSNNVFYRMDSAGLVDNPDQRIAEDLRLMASDTLNHSLNFLQNFANLVSYSVVLWGISGTFAFVFAGSSFTVYGYLLWAAFLYALVGTLVLERVAKPMVSVDYRQQQREADFRYLLVRLRESAEQIAFYSGAEFERRRLQTAFQAIRQNWSEVMRYTKIVTFFKEGYIEVGATLAYLLILPRYFAKAISLGTVQQAILIFSRVRGSFSWFIMFYKELAVLRAVYRRLVEFDAVLTKPPSGDIVLDRCARGEALCISQLQLNLPDGSPLGHVDALAISPGQRWLIRGPSGEGKSTLLRALAGLWPYGSGRVRWPEGKVMFVPQQSYLPVGSLRDAVSFPDTEQAFDAVQCAEVLKAVRLEHLAEHMELVSDWSKRLSQGEKQRLAFARILLHRPDYLFLDEATSALDEDNEHRMYTMLLDRMPEMTLISVAHRSALRAFHTHCLDLKEGTTKQSLLGPAVDPPFGDMAPATR